MSRKNKRTKSQRNKNKQQALIQRKAIQNAKDSLYEDDFVRSGVYEVNQTILDPNQRNNPFFSRTEAHKLLANLEHLKGRITEEMRMLRMEFHNSKAANYSVYINVMGLIKFLSIAGIIDDDFFKECMPYLSVMVTGLNEQGLMHGNLTMTTYDNGIVERRIVHEVSMF